MRIFTAEDIGDREETSAPIIPGRDGPEAVMQTC